MATSRWYMHTPDENLRNQVFWPVGLGRFRTEAALKTDCQSADHIIFLFSSIFTRQFRRQFWAHGKIEQSITHFVCYCIASFKTQGGFAHTKCPGWRGHQSCYQFNTCQILRSLTYVNTVVSKKYFDTVGGLRQRIAYQWRALCLLTCLHTQRKRAFSMSIRYLCLHSIYAVRTTATSQWDKLSVGCWALHVMISLRSDKWCHLIWMTENSCCQHHRLRQLSNAHSPTSVQFTQNFEIVGNTKASQLRRLKYNDWKRNLTKGNCKYTSDENPTTKNVSLFKRAKT